MSKLDLINDLPCSSIIGQHLPPASAFRGSTTAWLLGLVNTQAGWLHEANRGAFSHSPQVSRSWLIHTNNASPSSDRQQDQLVEVTFTAPSSSSLDLEVCVRADASGGAGAGKAYCIRYLNGRQYLSKITSDTWGAITDHACALTPGVKYRSYIAAVGVSPTTLYAWTTTDADPTTIISNGGAIVTTTDSTAALQNATGTFGVTTDLGNPFDGYVYGMRRWKITASGFTAGELVIDATGSAVTYTCTRPFGGTGPYTFQLKRSTTPNGTYSNVTGKTTLSGSDGTPLANVGYFYQLTVTDTGAGNVTSVSNPAGPIKLMDAVDVVCLIGDSLLDPNAPSPRRSATTDFLDVHQGTNFERLWERVFQTRRATVTPLGVGGATTDTYTDASYDGTKGSGYDTLRAAIIAAAPTICYVALGINDCRVSVTKAVYKARLMNVLAWIKVLCPVVYVGWPVWLGEAPNDQLAREFQWQYYAAVDEIVAAGLAIAGPRWENALNFVRHPDYDSQRLHPQNMGFDAEALVAIGSIKKQIDLTAAGAVTGSATLIPFPGF